MAKNKIHLWQLDILVEGDRIKMGICGAPFPELTENINEVTCKRCLKKLWKPTISKIKATTWPNRTKS